MANNKLPPHVNIECFEQLRLLCREYGLDEIITCAAYLCSYNLGEKYLLDTVEHLLKARDAYTRHYNNDKEDTNANKNNE